MKQINMSEVNFTKIVELLENKKEDMVVICKRGKPTLKVTLYNNRTKLLGCAKGMFEIPNDFDDIDISNEFEGEIFPH